MTELVVTVRRPPGAAEVHRFDRAPVVVGRGPRAGLRLQDPAVSDPHLRFVLVGGRWAVVDPGSTHGTRLGTERLAPGTPHPLRSADVLAVGPYFLEVFLEAGGGLTTDSRDTESRARQLVAEQAGGDALWVLSGPGAGASAPLSRHRPLVVGSAADCDLVIPGLVARHFEVAFTRGGLRATALGGALRVRGQAVAQAALVAEDHLAAGDSVFEVRGAAAARPWTALELVVLAVLVACSGLLVWSWLFE